MINDDTILHFIIACIVLGLLFLCAYVFPIGCRKNPKEAIDAAVSGYDVFLDDEKFESFNDLSRNEQRDYIRDHVGKTDVNDSESCVYLYTYECIRMGKKEKITEIIGNNIEEIKNQPSKFYLQTFQIELPLILIVAVVLVAFVYRS